MNILEELQEVVTKNSYTSNFDFESCEIEKEDIDYIKEREQKLKKKFSIIGDSIYDICIMLNEVSQKFKSSGDYMAWYEANGLTKDNVSAFNKRFMLFQEFEDKKTFISSLSNQAVKFLTHKSVSAEIREKVINSGIVKANEIKQLIAPIENQKILEYKKPKYKKLDKLNRNIEKVRDHKALAGYKNEALVLEEHLRKIKTSIKNKEKELENEGNLKIFDK